LIDWLGDFDISELTKLNVEEQIPLFDTEKENHIH